jgi:cytochrome c oxidase subunit II
MHRIRPLPLATAASPCARRRVLPIAPLVAVLPWLLAGCSGPQSALEPHGPHAALIAETWWVMFAGATLILLLVMAMALYAMYRDPDRRWQINPRALLIGAGLIFPVVTLVALLVYGTRVGIALLAEPETPSLRIEVVGQQFWWQVHYPDGDAVVTTANELYVPVGQPIEVTLETRDVIHSFWVPSLAGKTDLIPGKLNSIRFSADRPGVFLGQCAEFCGLLHAHMRIVVVALGQDAFEDWKARRAGPANAQVLAEHADALDHFTSLGCIDCHAIRGATAAVDGGPDLTHFGSRVDPDTVPTPTGRSQMAVWLRERHAIELMRRHGDVATPSPEQAESITLLLEALR